MSTYFGGKGGAEKYKKMMGKEKYSGERNVSRSKQEWKGFYKSAKAKALKNKTEKSRKVSKDTCYACKGSNRSNCVACKGSGYNN